MLDRFFIVIRYRKKGHFRELENLFKFDDEWTDKASVGRKCRKIMETVMMDWVVKLEMSRFIPWNFFLSCVKKRVLKPFFFVH